MATQKCPKCRSKRVRLGYHRTGFFSKLIFRYNLLCNNCNLQFVGFAIPGTVSGNTKRGKKIPDPNLNKSVDNQIALKLSDIPDKKELISGKDVVLISSNEVKVPTNLIEMFVVVPPKNEQMRKNESDNEEIKNSEITNSGDSEYSNQTKQRVRKRVKVRF